MGLKAFLPLLMAVQFLALPASSLDLVMKPYQRTVEIGEPGFFLLSTKGDNKTQKLAEVHVQFIINHPDVIDLDPQGISFWTGDISGPWNITIHPKNLGHAQVSTNITPDGIINDKQLHIDVTVELLSELGLISYVIGWIYFVAWSISFYPQILENWKRKSVVGLNFDFLVFNLIGFALYSVFNCSMFWSKTMHGQFLSRYPRSTNPVYLNDVVFSLHATAATLVSIFQCFIYERANQTVSITARILIGIFALGLAGSAICSAVNVMLWLDFVYICSYIKLIISLIKYIPQAYMNYKRKSTIGWSIGNIILDFTGGILSMLQMLINSYNLNDWDSIFGDPTKFGLGLFSVFFDIFFMIQHFILYRGRNRRARRESDQDSDSSSEEIPANTSYEVLPGNDYPEAEPEKALEDDSTSSQVQVTEVEIHAHSSLHDDD